GTSTASTRTCCGSLSTAGSPRRPTTCSWGTTWTGASSPWRPSACCWPTRSSTPRTSSCCGATTSAPPSTASTASTTSVNAASTSSCGRPLPTASTACPSPPSWTRRSSAATEVSAAGLGRQR
ncbi:unnamed protein product, partial [Tetraodon nigroviridis]